MNHMHAGKQSIHGTQAAPHALLYVRTETSPTHDFWTFWTRCAWDATTTVAQHPIYAAHAVQNCTQAAPQANGTETSPTHDFWTLWTRCAWDATTMVAQHPIYAAHAV
jgi:hypothetical protein